MWNKTSPGRSKVSPVGAVVETDTFVHPLDIGTFERDASPTRGLTVPGTRSCKRRN